MPQCSRRVRKLLPVPDLEPDRDVHVERLTDLEAVLGLGAEDAVEVALLGWQHLGEVGRDRADRLGAALAVLVGRGVAIKHQHRLDRERAVRRRAGQDAASEVVGRQGRIGHEIPVRSIEADVGHQAEEVVLLAVDPDEPANAHVLDRRRGIKARGQAVDERALDDQSKPLFIHHQSTSDRRIDVSRG